MQAVGEPSAIVTVFHVPEDFVANTGSTQVIVHFVTARESSSILIGNVGLTLSALFTPVNDTVSVPLSAYVLTLTNIASTSSTTTYNHYDAVFPLDQPIDPQDFALLAVSRFTPETPIYAREIYLTSLEFRYDT